MPDAEQYTELDLRGTLVALADRDEPDLDAFRARLSVADGGELGQVIEIGAPGEVIEIDAVDTRARRRSRFGNARTLAIAACVAAVLLVAGVALGLSRAGSSHGPTDPAASLPVPHSVLPGAVTLQHYSGVGPTSITVPHYRLPAHFELTAYVTCHGTGGIRVSGSPSTSCGNEYGRSFSRATRTLRVSVHAKTVWRLSVVRDPMTRTNGDVETPAQPVFPDEEFGHGSGRGPGEVIARAAPSGVRTPEMRLTCRGTGVTITSTRPGFPKLYTHTCFAGSGYDFRLEPDMLPATLHISAGADTTWRLVVFHD